MKINLNADIGEGFGAYDIGNDTDLMTVIKSASVACGFHAGDANTMHKLVTLAKAGDVSLGVHPGFNDLWGFGRRRIEMKPKDLELMVAYQIGALQAMAIAERQDESGDGANACEESQRQHGEDDERCEMRCPQYAWGLDVPKQAPGIRHPAFAQFARQRCANPGILSQKRFQIEAPDQVRVKQHRAAEDADQREGMRLTGSEPKAIP